jgi:hypothetical protein
VAAVRATTVPAPALRIRKISHWQVDFGVFRTTVPHHVSRGRSGALAPRDTPLIWGLPSCTLGHFRFRQCICARVLHGGRHTPSCCATAVLSGGRLSVASRAGKGWTVGPNTLRALARFNKFGLIVSRHRSLLRVLRSSMSHPRVPNVHVHAKISQAPTLAHARSAVRGLLIVHCRHCTHRAC